MSMSYYKIIDRGECYSSLMEFINGVYANKTEWAKHNFYPQNGMVGIPVRQTPRAIILKIMDNIYVPMSRNGIKEITSSEYQAGLVNNVCNGMDARQQNINNGFDAFGDGWKHLPDMKQYFKPDIINNMKKLTCDYTRTIFLPDLEKSCVIYATDMILEYMKQWGATTVSALPPYVIDEISEQVVDIYEEFFGAQFNGSSIIRCKSQIKSLVYDNNARRIIDDYYGDVNYRYSWK